MKLTTRKIIAREFLMFILVVLIGLISFLVTYPYNYYRNSQVENLNAQITIRTNLKKSLPETYITKKENQDWFYNKHIEEFGNVYKTYTSEELWKRLEKLAKSDSIIIRWDKVWSKDNQTINFFNRIGFSNPIKLHDFIKTNSFNKSELKNESKYETLDNEISTLNNSKIDNNDKVLSYNMQIDIFKYSLIVCLFVLFGLRYLYYAVRWSLKTLKEKTNE
jgi:hypothetical protein